MDVENPPFEAVFPKGATSCYGKMPCRFYSKCDDAKKEEMISHPIESTYGIFTDMKTVKINQM